MAESANLGVYRRALDAYNRRDADALVEICHPDVEFVTWITEVDGQSYRGHDGIRRWIDEVGQVFDEAHSEPQEVEEMGDFIFATGRGHWRGRGSGVPVEMTWGQGVEMRDGRAVWFGLFHTPEEARAAIESRRDRSAADRQGD